MFCTQCGKQITDDMAFCPMYGTATGGASVSGTATGGAAASGATAGGVVADGASAPAYRQPTQAQFTQTVDGGLAKAGVSYGIPLFFAVTYCVLNFFYLSSRR